MVLGIPGEKREHYTIQLKSITDKNAWWDEVIRLQA
jgi:hypothetical protein